MSKALHRGDEPNMWPHFIKSIVGHMVTNLIKFQLLIPFFNWGKKRKRKDKGFTPMGWKTLSTNAIPIT